MLKEHKPFTVVTRGHPEWTEFYKDIVPIIIALGFLPGANIQTAIYSNGEQEEDEHIIVLQFTTFSLQITLNNVEIILPSSISSVPIPYHNHHLDQTEFKQLITNLINNNHLNGIYILSD